MHKKICTGIRTRNLKEYLLVSRITKPFAHTFIFSNFCWIWNIRGYYDIRKIAVNHLLISSYIQQDRRGWGKFQLATSFPLLEYMIIWCKIQVKKNPFIILIRYLQYISVFLSICLIAYISVYLGIQTACREVYLPSG